MATDKPKLSNFGAVSGFRQGFTQGLGRTMADAPGFGATVREVESAAVRSSAAAASEAPDRLAAAGTAGNLQAGLAGGGESSSPKKSRRRPSTYIVHGGRREVKAYPLTEDDLTRLGLVQGGATFFISLAGVLLGFWLNITQSIAFSSSTPQAIITFWDGLRIASLVTALVSALLGGLLAYSGWSTIGRIKNETTHD